MDSIALKHQFPFYNDLHAIFTARMQKNWWIKPEDRSSKCSKRKSATERFSSQDPNNDEVENKAPGSSKKTKENDIWRSNLKKLLKGFVKREMEMERQWRETFRVIEEERRLKKEEWRMKMEALERENMMMEIMWREKEEERREREETRAMKRDALISTLFNSLIR